MAANPALNVTNTVKRALRGIGELDNVIKTSTRETSDTNGRPVWRTTVDLVHSTTTAERIAGILRDGGYGDTRVAKGLNFMAVIIDRPLITDVAESVDTAEPVAADNVATIADTPSPKDEATIRAAIVVSLAVLLDRPVPGFTDWAAADPGTPCRVGNTVIVREGALETATFRYGKVFATGDGGNRVHVAWLTPNALETARRSLRPEMLRPDYADLVGQDARHRVTAAWVLGERLSRFTGEQRRDATFLREKLGGLVSGHADPVAFARHALDSHRGDVQEYRTRERHADAAYDAAYRPALTIRYAVAKLTRPEAALAALTHRTLGRDAVRVTR